MVVDPDCPVCSGTGTLVLGPALSLYGADVASRAVEYGVEAAAREAMSLVPGAAAITAARYAVTVTVAKMRVASLLAYETSRAGPLPATRLDRHEIHDRARSLTVGYETGDSAALDAPPLLFDPDDRPLAHGGIPGFSVAGYVCHMSRAADPVDPLAPTAATRELAHSRTVLHHRAQVLASAVASSPVGASG
jgi:hypothetical protein